jgi:hypothetical protein
MRRAWRSSWPHRVGDDSLTRHRQRQVAALGSQRFRRPPPGAHVIAADDQKSAVLDAAAGCYLRVGVAKTTPEGIT